ncbi:MAG: RNA polymerase sigma factor RpoD/SigA [Chitinispirillaceae bacterium]|nr:RNA polymerase sigma factor RpoD/SigA [Chitinispirillaceae bacterium]
MKHGYIPCIILMNHCSITRQRVASKDSTIKNNKYTIPIIEENLSSYFKEIRDIKPLSREEECLLMGRIRRGEKGARDELIKANLKFVVGVSRNYQHQGLPLCDLINEGNLGLIRASMHFDESKNFKFISYAVWWIRQAILTALSERSRIVRMPINRSGIMYQAGQVHRKLEQRFQRTPMLSEIASEMGVKEQIVSDTLRIGNKSVSLDLPVGENGSSCLIEQLQYEHQLQPDSRISEKSVQKVVESALGNLSEREKEIIKLYFGIGHRSPVTLDTIAKKYKLTRERIRQIKEKAINRLKNNSSLDTLNRDK